MLFLNGPQPRTILKMKLPKCNKSEGEPNMGRRRAVAFRKAYAAALIASVFDCPHLLNQTQSIKAMGIEAARQDSSAPMCIHKN
jgi:hypothetical protein